MSKDLTSPPFGWRVGAYLRHVDHRMAVISAIAPSEDGSDRIFHLSLLGFGGNESGTYRELSESWSPVTANSPFTYNNSSGVGRDSSSQPPRIIYKSSDELEHIQPFQSFGCNSREQARRFGLYYLGLDLASLAPSERSPSSTEFAINDRTCKYFNQRASFSDLRCAVNPSGACDGCSNYEPLTVENRGDLSGRHDDRFAEYSVEVNAKVEKQSPVTRSLDDMEARSCRIFLATPSLFSDFDQGNSIHYRIDISLDGRSWTTSLANTLNGKMTSHYQWEHSITFPENGFWRVRVVRESEDSESLGDRNELYWLSYASSRVFLEGDRQ